MDKITQSTVAVAMAIIGLATLAVIVSRNSNTAGVVSAVAGGFSQSLGAAMAPVTGGGGGGGSRLGSLPRFSVSGGFA